MSLRNLKKNLKKNCAQCVKNKNAWKKCTNKDLPLMENNWNFWRKNYKKLKIITPKGLERLKISISMEMEKLQNPLGASSLIQASRLSSRNKLRDSLKKEICWLKKLWILSKIIIKEGSRFRDLQLLRAQVSLLIFISSLKHHLLRNHQSQIKMLN